MPGIDLPQLWSKINKIGMTLSESWGILKNDDFSNINAFYDFFEVSTKPSKARPKIKIFSPQRASLRSAHNDIMVDHFWI